MLYAKFLRSFYFLIFLAYLNFLISKSFNFSRVKVAYDVENSGSHKMQIRYQYSSRAMPLKNFGESTKKPVFKNAIVVFCFSSLDKFALFSTWQFNLPN